MGGSRDESRAVAGGWPGRAVRILAVALPLLAAAVPPVLVADYVDRYGVDAPAWDQWQFAPLVTDAAEGRLRPADLWAQHNEHRLVLPRLLMLALAAASRWNVRWELAANLGLASVTLALLAVLLQTTVGRTLPAAVPWLVLVASGLSFSPSHWENWLFGWQLQIFLAVLLAVAAALTLARWRGGWQGLALLTLLAIAGALSFASGLVLLVLVPLAVATHPLPRPLGRRLRDGLLTLLPCLLLLAAYLHGYERPAHHPDPSRLLADPAVFGQYVLAWVGASLALSDVWGAMLWGAIGLAVLGVGGTWLVRRGDYVVLVPWAFLAAHSLASAGITGVGRAGLGIGQALSSRYVTIAAPLWLAVAVVLTLVLHRLLEQADRRARPLLLAVVVVTAGSTLAMQAWRQSWAAGLHATGMAHRDRVRDRECILHIDRAPEACIAALFPARPLVMTQIDRLRQLQLGPFRPTPPDPPLEAYPIVGTPGSAGRIEIAGLAPDRTDELVLTGWARDPFRKRAAREVLVVADGRVLGRTRTGLSTPPGVTRPKRAPCHSGWVFRIPTFVLDPGPHELAAFALVHGGTRRIRIAGAPTVVVSR